jgi:broad specificity phosphatase PhoE
MERGIRYGRIGYNEGVITFYLIRHGQKEAIPFDPPLTKIGVKQAEVTAKLLKGIAFKAVIASPKKRTQETAAILSRVHGLEVLTDPRLVERLEWEHDESFDEFIREWNKTDLDRKYHPEQGMSSLDNGERMRLLLEELTEKYIDGNILLVSHGGTIGDLLRNLFTEHMLTHKTEPISGAKYIDILECSITMIEKNADSYNFIKIGDTSHLSIPLT